MSHECIHGALMATRLTRLASALRSPLVRGLAGHGVARTARMAVRLHAAAPCRWLSTSGAEAESAWQQAPSATEGERSEENTATSEATTGVVEEPNVGLPEGLTDERLASFLLNEWEAPKRSVTVRCA